MRTRSVLAATLATTVGIAFAVPLLTAATGIPRAEAASPAAVPDAPTVPTLASMRDGFKWGVTHTDVVTNFTKLGGLIDKDYDPLLRKAQPGLQQQAIEADRDNKKSAIERSWLKFVSPTGYDATGLKSEYSYRNNEAILRVERQGKTRYFFFMGQEPGERLWKIYDEIALSPTGPLGGTFAEAVNRMQGVVGLAGRVRPADPSKGLDYTTVDWQDGTTHARLVDRSTEHVVGVVVEERATLNALPQLRSNKSDDLMAIDPSIAAATRSDISDPSHQNAAPASSGKPAPKKR